jgi:hypothetical protein
MAHNNETPGGDSLYDDAPDAGSAATAESKEDEGGETALIPKSLCPGMKPGDEVTLKIERVLEDQYEASYTPKGGEEESEPAAEMPPQDEEMAGMMS